MLNFRSIAEKLKPQKYYLYQISDTLESFILK